MRVASTNSASRPSSEPSDSSPPLMSATASPPTSARGSVRKTSAASRQLLKAAWRSRKEASAAASATTTIRVVLISSAAVRLQHLGVVLEREPATREPVLDLAGNVVEAAAADVRLDVEPARDRVALDRRPGVCPTRTSATSAEAHVPAARPVEQQVAHAGHAAARCWDAAARSTSKTFCSSKMLPTWMPWISAASARRTSPGLIPEALRPVEVDLDLEVGWVTGSSSVGSTDAVDPRHDAAALAAPRGEASRGPARKPGPPAAGRSLSGRRGRCRSTALSPSRSAPTSRMLLSRVGDDVMIARRVHGPRRLDRRERRCRGRRPARG